MSRTYKWEHRSDSWHVGHKLERQARPAGRIVRVLEAELASMSEPEGPDKFPTCFVPVMDEAPLVSDWDDDPFCYVCGRCTDHFAEHCDLVELGYCYYTEEGSVHLTPAGREYMIRESYSCYN